MWPFHVALDRFGDFAFALVCGSSFVLVHGAVRVIVRYARLPVKIVT